MGTSISTTDEHIHNFFERFRPLSAWKSVRRGGKWPAPKDMKLEFLGGIASQLLVIAIHFGWFSRPLHEFLVVFWLFFFFLQARYKDGPKEFSAPFFIPSVV